MILVGKFNDLKVVKHVDFGVFLDGGDAGEILLPLKYLPEACDVGDTVHAFIHFDSDDRLIATTETPLATVGEFATLRVLAVEEVGAFLDWGLAKDLFLPYSEQTHDIQPGDNAVVYIYLDKSGRISASTRLERYIDKSEPNYEPEQEVKLRVVSQTDLGYKALVDDRHWGMIYRNEVFKQLYYGETLTGYIRQVREDGKIDLSLQRAGHLAAVTEIGPQILKLLEKNGGHLKINDKTSAEEIQNLFGVSKKKYKIALGQLYKNRLITVSDDGIRSVKKS